MTDYRMYTIGPDDHFAGVRDFVCETDEDALIWAKQWIEDKPIELWSGERLVNRLSPVAGPKHGHATSHEVHEGKLVPKPADKPKP